MCKSLGFAGCWVTEGKILCKKTPTSRVMDYNSNPPTNVNVKENLKMVISHETVTSRNNVSVASIINSHSGQTHSVTTGVDRDARFILHQNTSRA